MTLERRNNMLAYLLIALVTTIVLCCDSLQEGPDQEGPENRTISIIVNADDCGVTGIFTDGSIAVLQSGRISSTSIIVPGHDAERAMEFFADHPEYPAGVHLALTGDWAPLTPREEAPSLYNEVGTMWTTSQEVAANVRAEEARIEFDAQIRTAIEAGVPVTHVDGHMGCCFQSPELFMAALETAEKFNLPLIAPYIPDQMAGLDPDRLCVTSYVGVYQIPGAEETLENRVQAYRELLGGLGPGIHYIYSHHAQPQAETEVTGDLAIRFDDFSFWTSSQSTAMLEELGINLVSPAVLTRPESR
jgi:predicted glycoside hydrolase/deacetylase ChbG (UPF0249 family)